MGGTTALGWDVGRLIDQGDALIRELPEDYGDPGPQFYLQHLAVNLQHIAGTYRDDFVERPGET